MTVLENIMFPLTVGKKTKFLKKKLKKIAEEYMQLTNIEELAGKKTWYFIRGNNNVWPSLVRLFKKPEVLYLMNH